MKRSRDKSAEQARFDEAMERVLKADPKAVKAAMEAERKEREQEAKKTGKRGRGRPPKGAPSGPASS